MGEEADLEGSQGKARSPPGAGVSLQNVGDGGEAAVAAATAPLACETPVAAPEKIRVRHDRGGHRIRCEQHQGPRAVDYRRHDDGDADMARGARDGQVGPLVALNVGIRDNSAWPRSRTLTDMNRYVDLKVGIFWQYSTAKRNGAIDALPCSAEVNVPRVA